MSSDVQESERQSDLQTGQPPARGILFVVSSPSGGGKGTLINRVLNTVPGVSYSVSYTTRAPRDGEVNGRDYFFVSPDKFEAMLAANEFLEWARVHRHLYGTARQQVWREMSEGRDIILELDVQGAASVRELVANSVSVFILPPSFEVLRQRLIARGTDSREELEVRLRNAPAELKHYTAFDYVIINDAAARAAAQLVSIVYAERARRERQEDEIRRVADTFPSN
jgi:guanylate kinase